MKKFIFTITFLAMCVGAFAQNEAEIKKKTEELTTAKAELAAAQAKIDQLNAEIQKLKPIVKWKMGGYQSINFNQGSFTNWAKGGVNSVSVTFLGNLFANYKFNNWTWDNNLDMSYGVIKNKGQDLRKNEDKIDLLTKVGRKASKRFSWAGLMRFESQFAEGFDFNSESTDLPVISRFAAPAYIKASLGLDFKPNDKLSIYLSPAAGKWTIVNDDSIAALNLYIPETHDNPNFRGEFGALMSATYQDKEFIKNVGLKSTLELFNNFTDPNKPNRKNIDVDWQVMLNMKVSKYIGANLFTHVLYDNDTKIEYDPINKPGVMGPRLQFKELFGIGFSLKF
ncbi:MAG: DUF3078 domain-containing protein [Flavobacteriales bacterium]|nr:DUF3078 domain-containing protein [Bacteroidota bacterium]MCB9241346.1 DUF3078 domain-containing protein [Flavobacteriales bacterium]